MPADESPAALARRALEDVPNDGGIDPQLALALIEAIVEYPTFDTACAACGVTARSVRSMLERGAQVGVQRSLRSFSRRLAKADADNARLHYLLSQKLVSEGNSAAARIVVDLMNKRWGQDDAISIMSMLSGGKRSENLKARLERPSPLLGSLLADMLRRPNDAWASLLKGAGYVRAMAQESAPPAPAPQEPEQRQEDEPDGSGV